MLQLARTKMTAGMILVAAATALCAGARAAETETASSYASDLGNVYLGYHQVVTQKEVCDSSVPATRAANGKAFAEWQARHKALMDDVQRRVTAMIRLASVDEKDYARNVGKYEGEMLQVLQEHREALLKLGANELRGQCQRMAAVLRSPESDLATVYAAELEAIRKRK
jgi:hypothetical protein